VIASTDEAAAATIVAIALGAALVPIILGPAGGRMGDENGHPVRRADR